MQCNPIDHDGSINILIQRECTHSHLIFYLCARNKSLWLYEENPNSSTRRARYAYNDNDEFYGGNPTKRKSFFRYFFTFLFSHSMCLQFPSLRFSIDPLPKQIEIKEFTTIEMENQYRRRLTTRKPTKLKLNFFLKRMWKKDNTSPQTLNVCTD